MTNLKFINFKYHQPHGNFRNFRFRSLLVPTKIHSITLQKLVRTRAHVAHEQ